VPSSRRRDCRWVLIRTVHHDDLHRDFLLFQLQPSCLSTASKMEMPSAPASPSSCWGVNVTSKSQAPARPVLSTTVCFPGHIAHDRRERLYRHVVARDRKFRYQGRLRRGLIRGDWQPEPFPSDSFSFGLALPNESIRPAIGLLSM